MSTLSSKFNTKGGKGYKKYKSNRVRPANAHVTLDVEGGDGYFATVKKLMGGNKVMVELKDGSEQMAIIPGRMYKRRGGWMRAGCELLINNDHEIVKVVRETDKDYTEAAKKDDNNDIFGDNESEEETDDIYSQLTSQRSANVPVKGTSRKQIGEGKNFSNVEELEAFNIDDI